MYNLLIGGAAGQGVDTIVEILEKLLKKSGNCVFTARDFMSRVRGGHNFSTIRFGNEMIQSHSNKLDGIIALNEETIQFHKDRVSAGGFIMCDSKISLEGPGIIKIDMEKASKELGNPHVAGTIAAGAVMKLFGQSLKDSDEVIENSLNEKYWKINKEALKIGFDSVEKRFDAVKGDFKDWMLLSGSQALALGSIAAGLRFYSAYPMSPSTPIMVYLASKSKEANIVVEQAEDEIAAINMALGASFAGARAMTGTSGGGFSLMVEALGFSGIAEIPLVIVDVQRPGPATGLPTRTEQSDLKFVISASQGEFPRMVIALRNHRDSFYQTIRAFHLAEKYQIPVIILSDQYLGDSSATVEPFDLEGIKEETETYKDKGEYLRYRLTENGVSPRLIPGKTKHLVSSDSDEHDEHGRITESAEVRVQMVDKRMKKLDGLAKELQEPEFIGDKSFKTLLVGWGSTYGPLAEAVRILNSSKKNQYAALIFGDIYPLPQKTLLDKAKKAERIINVEQNATGQLAALIREQTGLVFDSAILKYDGRQMTSEDIVARIESEAKK
ncbi:MAG: 2-oxoacid:acceptor oxidoreductase subunit alpha [Clostridia bacterium]|nr:2-oxoacid:acceptor oxidoreductase subunit alpha [Clostridia bacterium]